MGSSTKSQSVYISFDSGSTISFRGGILNQKSVSLPLFDFSYRIFLQGGILNSCFVSMTMTPQAFGQSLFLFALIWCNYLRKIKFRFDSHSPCTRSRSLVCSFSPPPLFFPSASSSVVCSYEKEETAGLSRKMCSSSLGGDRCVCGKGKGPAEKERNGMGGGFNIHNR